MRVCSTFGSPAFSFNLSCMAWPTRPLLQGPLEAVLVAVRVPDTTCPTAFRSVFHFSLAVNVPIRMPRNYLYLKVGEKSRLQGVIGFGFAFHGLKNWRDLPITHRGNCNRQLIRVITFDSHFKTVLSEVNNQWYQYDQFTL